MQRVGRFIRILDPEIPDQIDRSRVASSLSSPPSTFYDHVVHFDTASTNSTTKHFGLHHLDFGLHHLDFGLHPLDLGLHHLCHTGSLRCRKQRRQSFLRRFPSHGSGYLRQCRTQSPPYASRYSSFTRRSCQCRQHLSIYHLCCVFDV